MKLTELYRDYVSLNKKLIGTQIAKATYKTYVTREKVINKYLDETGQPHIKIQEIKIRWIREFAAWLYYNQRYCENYVNKHIQLLGKMFNVAIENEYAQNNPTILYKYKYKRNQEITYLEHFELRKLENLNLITPHLQKSKDLYLFLCYTGLGYIDLSRFSAQNNIILGFDEKQWIQIKRKKTTQESILPLLQPAFKILEKYEHELPVITNQAFNRNLKVIFKLAGINKRITTHTARKTFANLMHNDFGVAKESVSRMIGHTSIRTTEAWYCTTNMRKIAKDMREVISKLAS
jgi:site-specific recombinase XerD